ncbi:MAG: peptide deformylase [Candidatus Vecturithrix sp.]|nr:peptide deformylase [Candidatus Vecturithrix sp.]
MDGEKLIKLVNPQITGSKGHSVYEEGCLSLPGFSENVPRAANIVVDGYDERGKPVKIETDTFLAIVLQMATAIEHVPNELTITVIYDNHILNKNIRVQIYLPQSFSARFKQDLQRYGAELIEVHDAVEVCPGVYSTGAERPCQGAVPDVTDTERDDRHHRLRTSRHCEHHSTGENRLTGRSAAGHGRLSFDERQ